MTAYICHGRYKTDNPYESWLVYWAPARPEIKFRKRFDAPDEAIAAYYASKDVAFESIVIVGEWKLVSEQHPRYSQAIEVTCADEENAL